MITSRPRPSALPAYSNIHSRRPVGRDDLDLVGDRELDEDLARRRERLEVALAAHDEPDPGSGHVVSSSRGHPLIMRRSSRRRRRPRGRGRRSPGRACHFPARRERSREPVVEERLVAERVRADPGDAGREAAPRRAPDPALPGAEMEPASLSHEEDARAVARRGPREVEREARPGGAPPREGDRGLDRALAGAHLPALEDEVAEEDAEEMHVMDPTSARTPPPASAASRRQPPGARFRWTAPLGVDDRAGASAKEGERRERRQETEVLGDRDEPGVRAARSRARERGRGSPRPASRRGRA